jgi:nucleotide-binding universal stress UspA family protein
MRFVSRKKMMIPRLKSILLVIRGNEEEEAAIRRAVHLASVSKSRLTALRVLRDLPSNTRGVGATVPVGSLKKVVAETARKDLERMLAPASKQGYQVQIRIARGTPFIKVIREVLRKKHDLVVLSASTKSALRSSLFGSMTMKLMRECPCPIWVVRAGRHAPFPRVLAALSPEFESAQAVQLNQKILAWSSSLAALEGGELHAGHAWNLLAESVLRGRAGVADLEVHEMAQQVHRAQETWLTGLLAPYGLPKTGRLHLAKGSPEVVIPSMVQRERIELLVMGTVSRTGVPGFLIGNTAEKVLKQVTCSVLTVKPDGFVTPVKLAQSAPGSPNRAPAESTRLSNHSRRPVPGPV